MDLSTIILLTMLPKAAGVVAVWTGILIVLLAAVIIFGYIDGCIKSSLRTKLSVLCGFLILLNASANMIPTRNELVFITGAYFATNIEGIDKLPPNIIKAVNSALEDISERTK